MDRRTSGAVRASRWAGECCGRRRLRILLAGDVYAGSASNGDMGEGRGAARRRTDRQQRVVEPRQIVTEIGFYHLTRTGPDQALPQLLGRTMAAGQRALVRCASDQRVASLDTALS